jgi:hypothetical protein
LETAAPAIVQVLEQKAKTRLCLILLHLVEAAAVNKTQEAQILQPVAVLEAATEELMTIIIPTVTVALLCSPALLREDLVTTVVRLQTQAVISAAAAVAPVSLVIHI